MHHTRPIRFKRRHHLRLRRLTTADLPGLRSISARRSTRHIEVLAGAERLAKLIDGAPEMQVGVELDHRLVGALVAMPIDWQPRAIAQPWDRREDRVPEPQIVPEGAVLRGAGAIWSDDLSREQIAELLTVGRKAVVQQLGLDGTVSVVEAPGWAGWRGRMTPEAYLQQVHGGGFGEPALRLLLEQGWVMRGFGEKSDRLQVVMWWGNRVR